MKQAAAGAPPPLLNIPQNPSHRDVCICGLQVLSGSALMSEQHAALTEIDAIETEMTALGRSVAQVGKP